MKLSKLVQVLILSLLPFVLINLFEKNQSEEIFLEVNTDSKLLDTNPDEIMPSCQIYEKNEKLITSENLENLSLSIEIADSRDWNRNLFRAYLDAYFIPDKYKKYYKSKFIIKSNDLNVECVLESRVRISGLTKNHLFPEEGISSLDIKIADDNFLGMTNFKAFIPQVRNYDNEILVTTLLNQLGYLSPNTFYMNIDFNGNLQRFLIQEKINSDFLFENDLREGPILEANNELAIKDGEEFNLFVPVFGKILNNKWLESNSSNVDVSLFALEKLNKLRIFSHDTKYLNLESLNRENKRLINEFTILMNSLDAGTGLYWDDRKFYFEPVTEILHPVYYDGKPKFIVENKLSGDIEISKLHNKFYAETYSLNEQTLIDLETKIKNLDYENYIFKLESKGVNTEKFKFNELEFKNTIVERIQKHQKFIGLTKSNEFYDYLGSIQDNKNYLLTVLNEGNFEICTPNLECLPFESNRENINNILKGEFYIDNNLVFYLGDKKNIVLNKPTKFIDYQTYTIDALKLDVLYTGKGDFKYENNILKIRQLSEDFKVLIIDDLITFNIEFENEIDYTPLYERYDSNLLTGCVNIYNSMINKISISISNSKCEDGVNIVKSSGIVEGLFINNALFDGADFDYSTITINNIEIFNSLNDCLDVSKGSYLLEILKLNKCMDKGISVGEESKVIIENIFSTNTNIAIAVKDSSSVDIKNAKTDNTEYCIQMYRKKESFNSSYLKVEKLECTLGKIYIGKFNIYEN